MSVNDVFVFSNVTGTDAANFNLRGGVYGTTIVLAGGSVTLNVLAADETTWVPFQTWSSSAAATLTLVAGLYQFAWDVGATEATFGLTQQPPTPNWRLQALSQPLPINANAGNTNYQTLPGFDGITLETPDASGSTGSLTIQTGNSSGADSGSVTIQTGSADTTRGDIILNTNNVVGFAGLSLTTPDNGSGDSQPIVVQTGTATGTRGSIELNGGTIVIPNLPTDSTGLPVGTLWNDSGTLKVA